MVNAETPSLDEESDTYRNRPEGSTVAAIGPRPAGKGEPGTGVKAPVLGLMMKAETLLELVLATYTNRPEGSTVTETGAVPTANGEPGTAVNTPVLALIVKPKTLREPSVT